MNAVEQIITDLNEVLKDLDAQQVIKAKEWAKARVAAIREFKASQLYQDMRRDSYKLYGHLHAIAGGKTWYGIFNGRNEAMINEFMEKNCAAIAAKRNASIAKKLAAFEVATVTGKEFTRTSDGFHGFFELTTDSGKRTVHIDTIYAGGYNIQCFHQRTLVKVR